jgi:ribonuclease P protein component
LYEEDISTKKKEESQKAWIQKEDAYKRRQSSPLKEKEKGTQKTNCLEIMLPAKFRLKSKKEFDELFKKGKTLASERLIMKYSLETKLDIQVGFSAGLKFSKKATDRNKAKRWLREAVRAELSAIKPGAKIIFIINPRVKLSELSYSILKAEIQDLLRKGELL